MSSNKSPIQRLHEEAMKRQAERERQRAESLRQKPGYDMIGGNQTESAREKERAS